MAPQRKNRQTDKHDVYRWSLLTGAMCWRYIRVEKNSIRYQTYVKTEDHIELKLYFSSWHFPALILSTTENATSEHFKKKSMPLYTGFLSDYQVLLDYNSKQICSLIDGFMTSEDGYTLILPFTSKTGQSVAQNRQKIF